MRINHRHLQLASSIARVISIGLATAADAWETEAARLAGVPKTSVGQGGDHTGSE